MDDGGYRRAELWREPFLKNGRTLTFDAAMAAFRDATGRPGPAAWEMGTYVAGQDDYPVGGVSWYEAAAYARWAGKTLPTIYHWSRAADPTLSADTVPASNFSGKSLLPAGASGGITRAGTTDMAGNVKEWCLNATGPNRYILGGAWTEPVYMFNDPDAQSPFARHATYGFRCIKVDRPEDLSASLTAAIESSSRDPRKTKPVSEPVFQTWRRLLYSFDHGDLKVHVESVDDASPEWRMEKVSYAAAYGGERIPAYLFLPKNAKPPYQAVVIFPGGNVVHERASATTTERDRFYFIVRSGRALLYPIYKSTFERGDDLKDVNPSMTVSYREHMIMWAKDVGRSVDYLESRPDIAKEKIGLLGLSWGAELAPLLARRRAADLTRLDLPRRVQSPAVAARSRSGELCTAGEGTGVDAQRSLRLLGTDGDFPGAAVQGPRDSGGTQTPCGLRDITRNSAQRPDAGIGRLDGEVLGAHVAVARARKGESL